MRLGEARSWKALARGAAGIAALLAIWEAFALSGLFSNALTPDLGSIFATILEMLRNGSLIENTLYTLARVLIGFAIAFAIAVPLGILMGRYWFAERFFLPLVSALLPIPSVAWVPLFVLWFGIGNLATTLVVIYAAFFPLVYNAWRGVKAVNPLWLRAAEAMGAGRGAMFFKVIWPGTMPYIVTGARLAVGHAWIGVIGGELLASPRLGLGEVIFNAKEYLQSGVMITALIAIGVLGLFFERFVFQVLERVTVGKWGMVAGARGREQRRDRPLTACAAEASHSAKPALRGCGKMPECRHSGARSQAASPESINTDPRIRWLGLCSWVPDPALTGRPGMTGGFSASCQ